MLAAFYLENTSTKNGRNEDVLCHAVYPENCTITLEQFMDSVEKKPNFVKWHFPRERQIKEIQEALDAKRTPYGTVIR